MNLTSIQDCYVTSNDCNIEHNDQVRGHP